MSKPLDFPEFFAKMRRKNIKAMQVCVARMKFLDFFTLYI